MSATDFVDMETILFARNYYNTAIRRQRGVSEAVEILQARKLGQLSEAESKEKLELLRQRTCVMTWTGMSTEQRLQANMRLMFREEVIVSDMRCRVQLIRRPVF